MCKYKLFFRSMKELVDASSNRELSREVGSDIIRTRENEPVLLDKVTKLL